MSIHHGKTIEQVIRRSGYSISYIARKLGVNRRSVYNWFNQQHLRADLIIKIGKAINCDLSTILPVMGLHPEDFTNFLSESDQFADETLEWKDRYLELLERYNELLVNASKRI
jgi:transcriptional regulator with XRE-family HTH domain